MSFGASISCSHETRGRIKNYMARHGLATYDAALCRLLAESDGPQAPARPGAADRRPLLAVDDDEQNKKVPQLLSYALLSREERALKYFIGLKPAACDWVMRELCHVVRSFVRFRALVLVGRCVVFGGRLWRLS